MQNRVWFDRNSKIRMHWEFISRQRPSQAADDKRLFSREDTSVCMVQQVRNSHLDAGSAAEARARFASDAADMDLANIAKPQPVCRCLLDD